MKKYSKRIEHYITALHALAGNRQWEVSRIIEQMRGVCTAAAYDTKISGSEYMIVDIEANNLIKEILNE